MTRGLAGAKQRRRNGAQWFRQVDADVLKGNAILSGARDKPLLVLSHEGKGRVALLLTDQIWLWARGYDGGGPNADLTRRLAHWLMKEPDLEEEALRAEARGRDVTIERQTLKDEAAPVTATAPSGAQRAGDAAPERAGPVAHTVRRDGDGPVALRERRADGAGQCRAGEPARIPRGGVDHGETAAARRGDRRHRAAAEQVVRRRDAAAPRGDDATRLAMAAPTGSAFARPAPRRCVGVEVAPLGLGLWAMLALLSVVVTAWAWEGKR